MMGKIRIISWVFILSLFFSIAASGEYQVERPSVSSGREIFNSNCAGCHGEKGDGTALKGAFNFTDHEKMIYKNLTVFFNAVTNGVPDTAMPSFEKLSVPRRWDVVAYSWTFWADRDGVKEGKNIYLKNCASCHGTNGNGSGFTGVFDFANVSMMVREEPEMFFKSISNGVEGTAMPSWKNSLSENERWNAVKYIWTFQFKDYPGEFPSPATVPSVGVQPPGKPWYYTPAGMVIITISIVLTALVLYLFGKGMKER
ncbi:MAG: c-type cytochrome [ANME-2 cluster archaeon]|nr:c-type cytochrome [ANME-2 cluster archaeon]